MSSAVDSAKDAVATGKEKFEEAQERWPSLKHILDTVARYGDRRGNLHAAGITFTGILALIPILMVAFAIAGYVLAGNQGLLDDIQDSVVEQMPGDMGTQVSDLIDSAIASRATVGVVGLLGAALTGIGWMSGVRMALTEIWGGRIKRSAIKAKLGDLAIFVVVGLAFVITLGLSALGSSGLLPQIMDWLSIDDMPWASTLIRVVSILISVTASGLLFTFVQSRLPLMDVPFRNCLKAGFLMAVVFEILKAFGGIYLTSVMSGPAGAAFGSIIGIMVFAYLASRILLYVTAWCATDPKNAAFQVVDEIEPPAEEDAQRPVVVSPTYSVSAMPPPSVIAGAVAAGAVLAASIAGLIRR
ncbi:inner membrane protein YhjD [Gordonia amarae]|uniref:Inner membrane protein YhjD n=2 Tax=Gordonia amarae TaxID=36821 RepID=A0A857LL75_9ACTN|nr:YhjD/YihY/BrkB family envelope integrity protein [Gordonia amarae]MCS3878291.1 membrane protein [Gordonia amarae]QHN16943.1 inner membrane protein YhjD [Gordonia amarae]QHN21469.1 inner membrane protein YhjD [Gordonia amarae]QHN30319.1 inner membrane protein YhjD [Gordonia amarae]QHN39096.1 inner membrane protein YhjD [Gordonia amarae]